MTKTIKRPPAKRASKRVSFPRTALETLPTEVRATVAGYMPKARPDPFSDSFTTEEATISVDVGVPHGSTDEAIIIAIDCVGRVSLDGEGVAVVEQMLYDARANLAARKPL